MEPTREKLKLGIAAAKAGRHAEARSWLMDVVRADPGNETAWLWLSEISPSLEEKRTCVRKVLAVNPENAAAQAGLRWIEERLRRQEEALRPPPPREPVVRKAPAAPVPSPALTARVPSLPHTVVATQRWDEIARHTLGFCASPILAAWVNARFTVVHITFISWVAIIAVLIGSYLWASGVDSPRNPGMRALFGDDGLTPGAERLIVTGVGAALWMAGFGVILARV